MRPIQQNLSNGQSGQVVVEYTLLLVVGVMLAFIITTTLVSRDANAPGFLIVKWAQIIEAIGGDAADDLN
jgi:uncharacterized protein (UPF0333 family)